MHTTQDAATIGAGGARPGRFPMRPAVAGWQRVSRHDANGVAIAALLDTTDREVRSQLANATLLLELLKGYEHRRELEYAAPSEPLVPQRVAALDEALSALVAVASRTGAATNWDPGLVDTRQEIDTVCSVCRPFAAALGVDLVHAAPASAVICADATLFRQAVEFLIDFAVAQKPAGGAVVCGTGLSSSYAIVTVSGRGCGLGVHPAGLFYPFREARPLPTHLELRLWIARLIVERHGGRALALANRDNETVSLNLCFPARTT